MPINMKTEADFNLYKWITEHGPDAVSVLAGSATPYLSLKDIISLSSDPEATSDAFRFNDMPMALASTQGKLELRETIAATYDAAKSRLTADNIIVTNATTGANHIALRSLLVAGDHVIIQYPIYGPLVEEPRNIGCDISYLRLKPKNSWNIDLDELESLIKPGVTKLLILNNPSNPTGGRISTEVQRKIIEIAKKHEIIIHSDEIFRPFFHTGPEDVPASLVEHAQTIDYDQILTTCSLSKVYGLSGVRIGWIATRSKRLFDRFMNWRLYSVQSCSQIDELIATELLGPRCRPGVLQKHLNMAATNLSLIEQLVEKHKDVVEWIKPTAGAIAFMKFRDPRTGKELDDVAFCKALLNRKKLLLAPATFCFEFPESETTLENDFAGYVRLHFTTTNDNMRKGLALLDEFLSEERDQLPN